AGAALHRPCRRHQQGRAVQAGIPEDQPEQPHPRHRRSRYRNEPDGVGRAHDLSRRQDRKAFAEGGRAALSRAGMVDVADGRTRSHVRSGPPLREIQQGQGALCRGALLHGVARVLRRARPPARGSRLRRRRIFHRRHRHLALGLALRMADGRPQPLSQREAVVHHHRQAAGGAEGLQGAQGRRRSSDPDMTVLRPLALCVAALVLGSAQSATAQETIDRPVTIYVAGTAGGGIDLYARLFGRNFGRHVAGKPNVTVQVMPGAGGIRAANFLAEQAPRDGTAIATLASGPILEPLIGARSPGYDMSSFTWLGAMNKDFGLCIAAATTPFKTIDDVRRQQMVVAGTGAGSETDTWPIVLNDVLGTKFKLVTGYLGSQETILAIERGEAHGRCVFSLSALKIAKPDWLPGKKINVLVLTALAPHPDFPGVPAVVQLAARAEDRQLRPEVQIERNVNIFSSL